MGQGLASAGAGILPPLLVLLLVEKEDLLGVPVAAACDDGLVVLEVSQGARARLDRGRRDEHLLLPLLGLPLLHNHSLLTAAFKLALVPKTGLPMGLLQDRRQLLRESRPLLARRTLIKHPTSNRVLRLL